MQQVSSNVKALAKQAIGYLNVRNNFGTTSERFRNDFGNEIATTFEIILNHPKYTSQQIAKEINKTPRTVETYLAKLKNAGIIIRRGPKLGGHWKIVVEK